MTVAAETAVNMKKEHDRGNMNNVNVEMKGSLWMSWEKAGNDFDQAASLSDVLRTK